MIKKSTTVFHGDDDDDHDDDDHDDEDDSATLSMALNRMCCEAVLGAGFVLCIVALVQYLFYLLGFIPSL